MVKGILAIGMVVVGFIGLLLDGESGFVWIVGGVLLAWMPDK